ncbi:hypothetical protein SDC9_185670 [bioreactor metagenome]|uniref:Uncharacterized protein n=1 Tax=bioreactor metagenome TaxID=1076179 RepID=A0A645HHT3_9ZZZZ
MVVMLYVIKERSIKLVISTTSTVHDAFLVPSDDVAFMVAVPRPLASITALFVPAPSPVTTATLGLELVQVAFKYAFSFVE